MRLRSMLILAALAAAALLATVVGGASARSLRVSEKGLEAIWSEALGSPKTRLQIIDRTANLNIHCRVTLSGHFNETTIVKETTRDQGVITRGELESCEGGTATIKTETMPWGLRYVGFTGMLPVIRSTTAALIGARFRIREAGGSECETATEISHPARDIGGNSAEAPETGLERTGEANNITADRSARIPLRGEFACSIAGEGEFGGIGLIRNLPGTALIRATLI